jgi:hypothetical protein
MTDSTINEDIFAGLVNDSGTGIGSTPEPPQGDSIVSELWDIEDIQPPCQNMELNTSDALKFELETLTIERERLRKENKKLAEMLESIKIEEDIALLKEEVSVLGEEKERILIEIQRRRQSKISTI